MVGEPECQPWVATLKDIARSGWRNVGSVGEAGSLSSFGGKVQCTGRKGGEACAQAVFCPSGISRRRIP